MIFKLEVTPKMISHLSTIVRRGGSELWAGRVMAHARAISMSIGAMLVSTFNKTAVAMALRGQGSEDLPAHFGLSDSEANNLADGMADLIRSSVRLLSFKLGKVMAIDIRAVEKDWSKYLSLPGAQYMSSPSNIMIPVAKWLLVYPSIDIGAAAYDIVFSGENEKFTAQINKVSRSGRAIMVSLKALGGGGTPYVLPSIVSGGMGENFIEMTLKQKSVAVEAARILMRRVQ